MALPAENQPAANGPTGSNGMNFLPNQLSNVMPNVDDLFGEDVGVNLSMSPPATELRSRIDTLRRRGCCQCVPPSRLPRTNPLLTRPARRIAWSKSGTIASVTEDGLFVEFRYLRCDPDDASWQLSEPTRCDLVSGSEQTPLVHLSWSATGTPELAIIDAVGRLSLLSFSIALNRPYFFRRWDADPVDDLNAVVGCYWLGLTPPGRQYNVFHGPAVRDNTRYRYESSFVHSLGPFHPNPSKSALVCVTANGQAKLFFSQNNNRVEETSLDIERISNTDDLITHAAICPDKSRSKPPSSYSRYTKTDTRCPVRRHDKCVEANAPCEARHPMGPGRGGKAAAGDGAPEPLALRPPPRVDKLAPAWRERLTPRPCNGAAVTGRDASDDAGERCPLTVTPAYPHRPVPRRRAGLPLPGSPEHHRPLAGVDRPAAIGPYGVPLFRQPKAERRIGASGMCRISPPRQQTVTDIIPI